MRSLKPSSLRCCRGIAPHINGFCGNAMQQQGRSWHFGSQQRQWQGCDSIDDAPSEHLHVSHVLAWPPLMRSYWRLDPQFDLDPHLQRHVLLIMFHIFASSSNTSESAPVPIPGQTLRNTASLPSLRRGLSRLYWCGFPFCSCHGSATRPILYPSIVFAPAVAAASAKETIGMKIGVLI